MYVFFMNVIRIQLLPEIINSELSDKIRFN
jgi:hypothetical protein